MDTVVVTPGGSRYGWSHYNGLGQARYTSTGRVEGIIGHLYMSRYLSGLGLERVALAGLEHTKVQHDRMLKCVANLAAKLSHAHFGKVITSEQELPNTDAGLQQVVKKFGFPYTIKPDVVSCVTAPAARLINRDFGLSLTPGTWLWDFKFVEKMDRATLLSYFKSLSNAGYLAVWNFMSLYTAKGLVITFIEKSSGKVEMIPYMCHGKTQRQWHGAIKIKFAKKKELADELRTRQGLRQA